MSTVSPVVFPTNLSLINFPKTVIVSLTSLSKTFPPTSCNWLKTSGLKIPSNLETSTKLLCSFSDKIFNAFAILSVLIIFVPAAISNSFEALLAAILYSSPISPKIDLNSVPVILASPLGNLNTDLVNTVSASSCFFIAS